MAMVSENPAICLPREAVEKPKYVTARSRIAVKNTFVHVEEETRKAAVFERRDRRAKTTPAPSNLLAPPGLEYAESDASSTGSVSPAGTGSPSSLSPTIPDFLLGFETPMAMPPSYWTPKQMQKLPEHLRAMAEEAQQQAQAAQALAFQALVAQQAAQQAQQAALQQAALVQAAQQAQQAAQASMPMLPMQGLQMSPPCSPPCTPLLPPKQLSGAVWGLLPTRSTERTTTMTSLAGYSDFMELNPNSSPAPSVNGEKKRKKRSRDLPAACDHEMTVMLRNIPTNLTPKDVLQHLAAYQRSGVMDFLYVPIDFKTSENLGYAFINFNNKNEGARFAVECERLFPESEEKPFVQPARVEGLAANVKRFRNSSVMGVLPEECKPMIFDHGVPQPFPGPSKKLPPVGPRFRPETE